MDRELDWQLSVLSAAARYKKIRFTIHQDVGRFSVDIRSDSSHYVHTTAKTLVKAMGECDEWLARQSELFLANG